MITFGSFAANVVLTWTSWFLIASSFVSLVAIATIRRVQIKKKQLAAKDTNKHAMKNENNNNNGDQDASFRKFSYDVPTKKSFTIRQYNIIVISGIIILVFHCGFVLSHFTINETWIWLLTMIEFQLVFTIISQPQEPQLTYRHFRRHTKAFFEYSVVKRAFLMAKIRVCVYACIISISLFYLYLVIVTIVLLLYLENDFQTLYNENNVSIMKPFLFGINCIFSAYCVIDNILNFKWYYKRVLFCTIVLSFCGLFNFVAMFTIDFYVVALFHLLILASFICIIFGAFFGWFYNYNYNKKTKKKRKLNYNNKNTKITQDEKYKVWTRASATIIGATGVGKTRFLRSLISEKLRLPSFALFKFFVQFCLACFDAACVPFLECANMRCFWNRLVDWKHSTIFAVRFFWNQRSWYGRWHSV